MLQSGCICRYCITRKINKTKIGVVANKHTRLNEKSQKILFCDEDSMMTMTMLTTTTTMMMLIFMCCMCCVLSFRIYFLVLSFCFCYGFLDILSVAFLRACLKAYVNQDNINYIGYVKFVESIKQIFYCAYIIQIIETHFWNWSSSARYCIGLLQTVPYVNNIRGRPSNTTSSFLSKSMLHRSASRTI